MVQYNKKTLLSLTQSTDNNMKSFRSRPLPQSPRPLSCATAMWTKQQQIGQTNLVWGRIQDTGANYIVEGYQQGEWVTIPCRRLLDAKLLLGQVMSRLDFDLAKIGQ
tara:strand:- start:104 stop:424 length:321 start_codon:yes stop_codon:yes gene_type:complete